MSSGDSDDDEPMPSLAMGAVIAGKYRIERLIGRGGMGSVWSAVHVSLGQRVAVKLIAKRFAASREARHRFDLEAKAVAQLRSRYVVQVYDHGETEDSTPYIVMEYLEGESLDARIERGPLTLAQASVILDQVGRALARAHALGMVHRDLKPENIFITTSPDGDGEIAKVLDFGIVKMRGVEGVGSSTRTGAVLGTPLYMSPEQARGLKTVDHRTDVYSLAMVAYTMLTGQPAFTGESLGDLLVAICTEPLPDIRRIAHWLPAPMDVWFQRACAREPSARFSTVEEMTTAFAVSAGLVANAGIVTGPPQQGPGVSLPSGSVGGLSQHDAMRASAVSNSVGAVPVASAPRDLTAAPFSVTRDSIPKRSLAVPIAIVAGVVALAGAFVVTRLGRTPAPEPPSAGANSATTEIATSAPAPSLPASSVAAVVAPSASAASLPMHHGAAKPPGSAKPSAATPPAAQPATPPPMTPPAQPATPPMTPPAQPATPPPMALPSQPATPPPAARPQKPSSVDLGF